MEDLITVGILTVSDSCWKGISEDGSGDNLEKIVSAINKMEVKFRDCVPDDSNKIKETLIKWSDEYNLDIILTTGGTGFAERDVTPEATKQVIEKEASGISNTILIESLKITPFAMLSRAVCGIRKKTLIINLPGSKKASGECLNAVIGCLPHAVALLKDQVSTIKSAHSKIQQNSSDLQHSNGNEHLGRQKSDHICPHNKEKSQVDITRVARRMREQVEYPMIAVDDALNMVLSQATCIGSKKIDLRNEESRLEVIGSVLAENVCAIEPFPPFPASIKDGYAVIASDGIGPRKVIGDRVAGSSPNLQAAGERVCVRVNTGAPVPPGMDAVVQVEDTELLEEADDGRSEVAVNILTKPVVGQDIRKIGSDISKGNIVMEKFTTISSTELGLLATLGINEIQVFKSPRIGVLSTGDELKTPWTEGDPQPGCIRDSNKVTLIQLLKENGFKAIDCGISKDNPDDVYKTMSKALEDVDVLITTGSVSMGERDMIKKVLKTDLKADVHFGRVNMKPGKPMTFATCQGISHEKKLIFALPGNPSSAVVTCHVFVMPALRSLSGKTQYLNKEVIATIVERMELDVRPELKRAYISMDQTCSLKKPKVKSHWGVPLNDSGIYELIATTTGNQISSRLASLKGANGLLKLPPRTEERTHLDVGTKVWVYLIREVYCG